MENSKHTQAYAEKLALEAFPEKSNGSSDLDIAIENSKIGFKLGYMKAIEETAAPDMLEVLIKVKTALDISTEVDRKYWSKIINNAINKATK